MKQLFILNIKALVDLYILKFIITIKRNKTTRSLLTTKSFFRGKDNAYFLQKKVEGYRLEKLMNSVFICFIEKLK